MHECCWREVVGDICCGHRSDLHKRVAASGVGGCGGPGWGDRSDQRFELGDVAAIGASHDPALAAAHRGGDLEG
jgi:hypothetical protein